MSNSVLHTQPGLDASRPGFKNGWLIVLPLLPCSEVNSEVILEYKAHDASCLELTTIILLGFRLSVSLTVHVEIPAKHIIDDSDADWCDSCGRICG